jgi:hypothetical protein
MIRLSYKLHSIHFEEDDCGNEYGISVDFRNGVPEERLRYAVLLRRHPGTNTSNTPVAVAYALYHLADWINWKFSEPVSLPPGLET